MEIHPTFAPLRYFSRGMRVLRVGGGSTLYICCSEGTTQFQLYHSVYTIYKDFDELPQRRSLLSSGGPTRHNMQDVTWLGWYPKLHVSEFDLARIADARLWLLVGALIRSLAVSLIRCSFSAFPAEMSRYFWPRDRRVSFGAMLRTMSSFSSGWTELGNNRRVQTRQTRWLRNIRYIQHNTSTV